MNLLEKLNILMNKNNIKNTAQLSKLTSVPYTTLKSIFDGQVNSISLSTSRKLCNFFNITLDELLDDNIELSNIIINKDYIKEIKFRYGENSIPLLEDYAKLNNTGKIKANEVLKDLTQISKYSK